MCNNTNSFFNIMDNSDRILERDKFLKTKGYKSEWYEIFSGQTRSLIFTISIITIIILFIIY